MANTQDLTGFAAGTNEGGGRVSTMAAGLVGSEILKIAADIRELQRTGVQVCNLTVGDFDPKQFPIPDVLATGIRDALAAGHTNYPPSNGIPELREAVARFYERDLGLRYSPESVLIAGGGRPCIYGIYRAVVDPGDIVAYPVPSWNNNHYCNMTGATKLPITCGRETSFLPTADAVIESLPKARLLCLNSPLNPTGTAFEASALQGICEAVVAENHRREKSGARPLYLLYDHIYWTLTFAGVQHYTPPQLVPEMARWTIFVDGISKSFAATGVRVGWSVGPIDVIRRMSSILGHVGAWAPKAEQVATVALLDDPAAIADYLGTFKAKISTRLDLLYNGLTQLRDAGLPVDAISPMGAIYLTARVHPFGKVTPSGQRLETNEDVRKYILDAAGWGVVPFQAFDATTEGWFRLSVGAVSERDIEAALPRLGEALRALQ